MSPDRSVSSHSRAHSQARTEARSDSTPPSPSASRPEAGAGGPVGSDRAETPTEELARLLDLAEGQRLRGLPFDELRRLARLYRSESARLARLRDRDGDLDRIGYLNAVCVRAHALLYSARPRARARQRAWQAGLLGLAGTGRLQAIAWAILGIGAVAGYSLVALDPTALYALLPAGLGYDMAQIDVLARSPEARALFFAREATPVSQNALFGSYLFANNTRVGMMAFATGILAGIPTLLLQFFNGIMIGAISALFLQSEHAIDFLAWILPHGIPELTAITFCAAAGFALGLAVAAPGRQSRSHALRVAGAQALALLLASLPLFFAAAWIESFVRESALGLAARFAIAAAGALSLLGLAWGIRRQARLLRRGASVDEYAGFDHPAP